MSSFSASLLPILLLCSVMTAATGNFNSEVDITFGDQRPKILNGGKMLTLSLDKASGSGFKSKKQFLFGRFDVKLRLIPGNSAGTVTTYYLSSQGTQHDEIDFEFLGNQTGDPYTVHTNVYMAGIGGREKQFKLWFDPTMAYHTYTLLWNPLRIMWMVDNMAIRVLNNNEKIGVPFPKTQAMRVYSSLWNADDWATRGGLVKTDWTRAPFTASYSDFKVQSGPKGAWRTQGLNSRGRNRLIWVQRNFMTYDYCADSKRFPLGFPLECKYLGKI